MTPGTMLLQIGNDPIRKCQFRILGTVWNYICLLYTSDKLEAYKDANFLKGGMVFADAITTVSNTYAEEDRKSVV